jgi:putative DNA primase/helicase
MREDFWTFKPSHKLVLATNHKPRIKGTDHAIWRRLVLLPFEQRFWNPAKGESGPESLRQDKDLPQKLASETEGILAWMVRGCLDWQNNGLQIPDSVRVATAEYRTEEDSVGRFIADCAITGNPFRVKFSDLYDRLEHWCNESGDNIPSRKFLSQWLKDNGYQDKHSGARWYLGIGLRNDA